MGGQLGPDRHAAGAIVVPHMVSTTPFSTSFWPTMDLPSPSFGSRFHLCWITYTWTMQDDHQTLLQVA